MKDALLIRAGELARAAVQRYIDEDRKGFFVEGAGAFEMLGKARLAAFHPALVVDARSLDSLLHVTGAKDHAKTPSWQIKTISASDVLQRCMRTDPPLAAYEQPMKNLAQARNALVHLGEAAPEDEKALFVSFLRACEILLPGVGSNLATFFGVHAALVQEHLARNAQATKLRVETLLAAARRRFEQRFADLGAGKDAALKAIEANLAPEKYEEILAKCPACGQQAIVGGPYDVDWDVDVDEDGRPHGYPVVTLQPVTLHCQFCKLALQSVDDLVEVGLAEPTDIESVDPSDFYDYEDGYLNL